MPDEPLAKFPIGTWVTYRGARWEVIERLRDGYSKLLSLESEQTWAEERDLTDATPTQAAAMPPSGER